MLVKRLFMLGVILLVLIRTEDMIADSLTKALPRDKLAKCRGYMLNQDHGPNKHVRRSVGKSAANYEAIALSLTRPIVDSIACECA